MISVTSEKTIRSFNSMNGGKDSFPLFTIGKNSYINSVDIQMHPGNETINIQIGNYCSLAYNIKMLIDRNHDYKSVSTSPVLEVNRKLARKGQILIGHDVWIGNDVTLLSGIRIGNGAVIGAGTVVVKDVPPYAIVVGNPMQVIKYRFDTEQVKKLQTIRWWYWPDEKIEENMDWFGKDIELFTIKFYNEAQNSVKISKGNGKKRILFVPDFTENYPVWDKVIKEFINRFSSRDNTALVLLIDSKTTPEKEVRSITNLFSLKSDVPKIELVDINYRDIDDLFSEADYFITTRSSNTLLLMDYADHHNVRVLSGVDIPSLSQLQENQ